MLEQEAQHNRGQEHLEAVLHNIETVDMLDVSFLLTQMDNFYRKHITSITVKGPAGTVDIEPNVFASDVRFEQLDEKNQN